MNTYWITFLILLDKHAGTQAFSAGAFHLQFPLDTEDNIYRAAEKIEDARVLKSCAVSFIVRQTCPISVALLSVFFPE